MSAQFKFLNVLRRERRLVVVYLLGGTRLQGRIVSFDQEGLLLETKQGMVLCAQRQVSTVGLDLPRSMSRPRLQPHQPRARSACDGGKPAAGGETRATPEPARLPAREATAGYPADSAGNRAAADAPVVRQKLRRKVMPPHEHTGSAT